MTNQLNNFLGQGIILPLQLVNGAPPLVSGFDLLRASIITILTWEYGERFFLNEFGSRLFDLLEEPNDDVLQGTIRVFVIDAIAKWDHRIEVIATTLIRTKSYSLDLSITYRILNIKREDTFIFPFYDKIIY